MGEQGERFWTAMSRRFFEGKDTALRPIKLDSRELLLECADHAGLERAEAERVLDGDAFADEVLRMVREVHSAGIHSIPLFVLEVEDLIAGSWARAPRQEVEGRFRKLHHGSGSQRTFRQVLLQLHAAC